MTCTATTTPPTGITYSCHRPADHEGNHSAPLKARTYGTNEEREFPQQQFAWSDDFARDNGWDFTPHR